MELGSIKKIVQTEQEAERIKSQAKQQAETIVQDAIESRKQKETFAQKRVEEKRRQLEEKAKAENVDAIRKISDMTANECSQIEQKANQKMQTAVNAIFKEVIK